MRLFIFSLLITFFSAELAIGNIVRRVMHIIREEMHEETEDEIASHSPFQSHEVQPIAGGLSRALGKSSSGGGNGVSVILENSSGGSMRSFGSAQQLGQDAWAKATAAAGPAASKLLSRMSFSHSLQ